MLIDYGVNIKSQSAVIFGEYIKTEDEIERQRKYGKFYNIEQPKNNLQKSLSHKSSSRIKSAVDLLCACAIRKKVFSIKENRSFSFKVGFMTLTIPEKQKHTDKDFHKNIFAPFIRILQDKYDLAEYIWKAETQDNNNLHYHLSINVFIHHREIKNEWNKLLESSGYIFKTEGHRNATTQIKATKSIKNISNYLCKYLGKNEIYKKKGEQFIKANKMRGGNKTDLPENFFIVGGEFRKRKVNMKIWSCSKNIEGKKLTIRYAMQDNNKEWKDLINISKSSEEKDFYSIWKYDYSKMYNSKFIGKLWKQFVSEHRMKKKQMPIYKILSLK